MWRQVEPGSMASVWGGWLGVLGGGAGRETLCRDPSGESGTGGPAPGEGVTWSLRCCGLIPCPTPVSFHGQGR